MIYLSVYIYIYRERERERERDLCHVRRFLDLCDFVVDLFNFNFILLLFICLLKAAECYNAFVAACLCVYLLHLIQWAPGDILSTNKGVN